MTREMIYNNIDTFQNKIDGSVEIGLDIQYGTVIFDFIKNTKIQSEEDFQLVMRLMLEEDDFIKRNLLKLLIDDYKEGGSYL